MHDLKVMGVSDVSVGYGSPEVPALMDAICRQMGVVGALIEPDEIDRPPIKIWNDAAFRLRRITSTHPDHTPLWHASFKRSVVSEIENVQPDVLILFGSTVFSILLSLRYKPTCVIYHAYEYVSGLEDVDTIAAHRYLLDQVDLVIAPDVERLIVDLENFKRYPKSIACLYNAADVVFPDPIQRRPASERNGRFLWYGTLNRRAAFANHFLARETSKFQFDLFGRITDRDAEALQSEIQECPNIRYFGVAPAQELNQHRADCTFSMVWWNPELSPGHYYLPSNRFFTSIQAGVPPICAPHPQCVELVQRYGCGIIMQDWSLNALVEALEVATRISQTEDYQEMVENCSVAANELNWETQYERIRPAVTHATKGIAKGVWRNG